MTPGLNLRRLDAARLHDGPFTFRVAGQLVELPHPRDLRFEVVLTYLSAQVIIPREDAIPLTLRQAEDLFARWAAHYDLPSYDAAQRLAYVIDRYPDDLTYDLRVHAHMDLVEMWRNRRWRTLLATIDRLPSFSLYAEAVSKDDEHTAMLAKSLAERSEPDDEPTGPAAPPLRSWTPEMQMLTGILDATRRLEWAIFAAQAGKKAGSPPEALPRPQSGVEAALKRATFERKKARHEALTRRLLPHKRQSEAD